MRAFILAVLTVATLACSGCKVIGPESQVSGTQTSFALPAGHVLRVYDRGGAGGAERATAFPAATGERRFTVVYDGADRMLAVAFVGAAGAPNAHYFLAPTRFTVLPE